MIKISSVNMLKLILAGGITLSADSINCALVTSALASTYTTSQIQQMTSWVQLSAFEVSGTGYTAGGITLSGVTVSTSGTYAYLDADDINWSSANFTTYGFVLYKNTSKEFLCFEGFSSGQSTNAGIYILNFPSTGIIRLYQNL